MRASWRLSPKVLSSRLSRLVGVSAMAGRGAGRTRVLLASTAGKNDGSPSRARMRALTSSQLPVFSLWSMRRTSSALMRWLVATATLWGEGLAARW